MVQTSRAVVPGSRLFNNLFDLPRARKGDHEIFGPRPKAAPLQASIASTRHALFEYEDE